LSGSLSPFFLPPSPLAPAEKYLPLYPPPIFPPPLPRWSRFKLLAGRDRFDYHDAHCTSCVWPVGNHVYPGEFSGDWQISSRHPFDTLWPVLLQLSAFCGYHLWHYDRFKCLRYVISRYLSSSHRRKPGPDAHVACADRWDNPRSGVFKRFMTVSSKSILSITPSKLDRMAAVYLRTFAAYASDVCHRECGDKVQGGIHISPGSRG